MQPFWLACQQQSSIDLERCPQPVAGGPQAGRSRWRLQLPCPLTAAMSRTCSLRALKLKPCLASAGSEAGRAEKGGPKHRQAGSVSRHGGQSTHVPGRRLQMGSQQAAKPGNQGCRCMHRGAVKCK
jgi:hypothetical protein